jgi:hypothetical protein
MGAKGHVEVETIAARGTVEETMMGVENALSSTTRVSSESSKASTVSEYQRAKLLFLLQNLKLIRAEETSKDSSNEKRPREVSDVDEDTETPKKLPKVRFRKSIVGGDAEALKNLPRVRFEESTGTVASSLDREHGVSVSFALPRPLGTEAAASKTEASEPLHSCTF